MAGKQKSSPVRLVLEQQAPAANVFAELENDEGDPDEAAILRAIEADGADPYRLMVYRLGSRPGEKAAWLFDIEPSELEVIHAKLRDDAGPGKYEIMIRKGGAIRKRLTYSIAALKSAAAAPAAGDTAMTQVLAALERQQTQIVTLADRLSQREAPAAFDPMAFMERTVTMVTNLVKPAVSLPPVENKDNSMTFFMKGIEFAKDIATGDRETGLLDVAAKSLPAFLEAFSKPAAAPPASQAPAGFVPPKFEAVSTRLEAPAPIVDNQGAVNGFDPRVLMQLQQALGYLVSRAAKGSPPDLYAEWCDDNIPGPLLDQLLSVENPIGQLEALVPAVGQHRPWFENLVSELKGPGDAPETGGNAGNDRSETDMGGNTA